MTVESTITKEIYQGNGAATSFPVPFQYAQQADLFLLRVAPDGTETPITDNYQVVANESGDTSITYPVAGNPLALGYKLVIYRSTPNTQIVDLVYGGAFNPDVLEHDALDRLEMQIQEKQELLDRAIKVPIASDETPEDFLDSLYTARDDAASSAAASETSAQNSLASENLAHKWATNPEDEEVQDGEYSAYHWALKSEEAADSASTSENNASASASAAAQSESNAAQSEANAATSESNAAESAASAAQSEANSTTSENNASASASAAAQSESNAGASATAAAQSEANAEASATAAALSETNAAQSESNAFGSAREAAGIVEAAGNGVFLFTQIDPDTLEFVRVGGNNPWSIADTLNELVSPTMSGQFGITLYDDTSVSLFRANSGLAWEQVAVPEIFPFWLFHVEHRSDNDDVYWLGNEWSLLNGTVEPAGVGKMGVTSYATPDEAREMRRNDKALTPHSLTGLSLSADAITTIGAYFTEHRAFCEKFPPTDWLPCFGGEIQRASDYYPELLAALHTRLFGWKRKALSTWERGPCFGYDPESDTLRLPDTRDMLSIGAGRAFVVGQAGAAANARDSAELSYYGVLHCVYVGPRRGAAPATGGSFHLDDGTQLDTAQAIL
jgi:hypothetical protein